MAGNILLSARSGGPEGRVIIKYTARPPHQTLVMPPVFHADYGSFTTFNCPGTGIGNAIPDEGGRTVYFDFEE